MINLKVDCIITGSLGPKAFSIIQDSELKAYKNISDTVENNIKALEEGRLGLLTQAGQEVKKQGRRQ